MSQETGKDLEKVPSSLSKRYEILERLIKDIAASTAPANSTSECNPTCIANRVCSLLKSYQDNAGPSMSQPQTQQTMPMVRLTQAAGCTCKPGTRNSKTIDQINKLNYKKKISYYDEYNTEVGNWMDIDDYKQFGHAVAAELAKRSSDQAFMLKEKITKAVLGLDNESRKSKNSVIQDTAGSTKRSIQPQTESIKNDDLQRRSTGQSVIESNTLSISPVSSLPIRKRIDSTPVYASKSLIFQYDRKEEFGSKELVLEVESSLSIDMNDTGEELIEWPSMVEDEIEPPDLIEELKKKVEEKAKKKEP